MASAWSSIIGTVAMLAVAQAAARAQENRPTILLLDGLFIYVHQHYVGVSDLAPRLNAMGYRAVVDTHLMNRTAREEPAVIVGHSMGGSAALRFAREMKESGKPPPVVITIDAAFGSPPCAVPRCINFRSPGFPAIEGAENVDAWQAGAYMVNHAMLATNAAVQRLVLREAEAVLVARAVTGAPLTAPVPIPRPN